MAKKVIVDQKSDIIESLSEFSRFKNIDRAALMKVLEEIFRAMIRKKYGSDENFNIIVNVEKGDLEAFRERKIVSDLNVVDESRQIPLSEALKLDKDYKIGEEVAEKINFLEFGRRHISSAKQLLSQKISEMEKLLVLNYYKELIGEIIVGEVYQVWRNEILVKHEDNELYLPKSEQIPKDKFKKGEMVRALVLDAYLKNGSPRIILSRTSPIFLERLFEKEVPEILDGTVAIRKIVREPGERAKVAVESFDDRVDPVGACVGIRGTRIHGIMKELRNESIDVIHYTNIPQLYIQRALSPAKISNIEINEKKKAAIVYVKQDQISLAIGKGGQNVKLASKLTGYDIDVYTETVSEEVEDDVELDEFKDEIQESIIEELKKIGCDTARSVLQLSIEEIEKRTNLNQETIQNVLRILKQELED
ncbi:MAG: transcription termination factor NusA [Bacteroidia bacterium]|nr:transcription termination factor NusA [Bacteroidia bacterium]MDW8159780.1 transcription termination factor NusA [Bacteroidia bacterium]